MGRGSLVSDNERKVADGVVCGDIALDGDVARQRAIVRATRYVVSISIDSLLRTELVDIVAILHLDGYGRR